jgi:ubiquinol-cytochrome c reductase cytochrome b subunit
MFEAGSGYVLPWGQMSYWATKVLVQVYTVIPWIGDQVALWVTGDYNISGVTLQRFFALHVAFFPIVLIFLAIAHISALHHVGSNNPDGIDLKNQTLKNAAGKPIDTIPFHPYYTVKDLMGVAVFLIVFFTVVFFFPTMGGYFLEPTNFKEANPLVTPAHIAPPWYLAPLYAILRAIPDKLFGVIFVGLAIAFLFVMPWLDRSPVRSIRYRGMWSKIAISILVISFIMLSALGTMPLTTTNVLLSRIFLTLYFLFFITMPIYTTYEKCKPLPTRVHDD